MKTDASNEDRERNGEDPTPGPDGRIRSGKLAGRTLRSAIWIVAMPVLLQQTFAATVGLFDKILTGNLPTEIIVPAMDGIGIGSYISWFVGIAMSGLGIGAQAIIARAMGGGNAEDARDAGAQSMTLALIWGGVVGLLLWLLVEPLASLSALTPEAIVYLEEYISIIAIAMPITPYMLPARAVSCRDRPPRDRMKSTAAARYATVRRFADISPPS